MKPGKIAAIDTAIVAVILVLPALSIGAANLLVETGILTTVTGSHIVTLGYAYGTGISWPNVLTITGLLIVVDSAITALARV